MGAKYCMYLNIKCHSVLRFIPKISNIISSIQKPAQINRNAPNQRLAILFTFNGLAKFKNESKMSEPKFSTTINVVNFSEIII
jgi:hypothetical protein